MKCEIAAVCAQRRGLTPRRQQAASRGATGDPRCARGRGGAGSGGSLRLAGSRCGASQCAAGGRAADGSLGRGGRAAGGRIGAAAAGGRRGAGGAPRRSCRVRICAQALPGGRSPQRRRSGGGGRCSTAAALKLAQKGSHMGAVAAPGAHDRPTPLTSPLSPRLAQSANRQQPVYWLFSRRRSRRRSTAGLEGMQHRRAAGGRARRCAIEMDGSNKHATSYNCAFV